MTRVGKRSRRVAEAEALLVARRQALGEDVRRVAGHARTAATPGRVVAGGLALGALVGLVQPAAGRRRERSGKPAGSTLESINRLLRLVSMAVPLVGMLRGLSAAGAHESAEGGGSGADAHGGPAA